MKNIIVQYYFLIIVICFTPIFSEQTIEWSPSKQALEYQIEIRELKTKKIKINKKIKETKFKINKLSEGLYEYRIGIISKKNETVFTEWTTLSIIQSQDPEVSTEEFYFGSLKDRNQELFINGNNFLLDTKIEVYSDQYSIPIKKLVIKNETELSFTLDLMNAKPGIYDLKIINPLNKIFIKKNFYILDVNFKAAEERAKKIEKDERVKKYGSDDEKPSLLARSYFLRSALIPGWGQIASGIDNDSKGKKYRGYLYMSFGIGALGYFTYNYKLYRAAKNDANDLEYQNNLINQPFNFPLSAYGTYTNNKFNTSLDNLENRYYAMTSAATVFAGVYLINLIDAYFFTGRKRGIFTVEYFLDKPKIMIFYDIEKNQIGYGNQFGFSYQTNF